MSVHYSDSTVTVHHGDCLEVMAGMPENSVDAIVTDPPYGLGFMGRKWDGLPPSLEWAEACYRVLKPGGHIAAFGGTRTWHRLAVAIEDAGFEMRDSLAWLYGSGFPKSHDVGKAIDKLAGAEREVVGSKLDRPGYHLTPGVRGGEALGQGLNGHTEEERLSASQITAPATPEAAQWDGWGTSLKPGHEPVVLARKPLAEKTVARNVLAYGTGAINVDGCRIGMPQEDADFIRKTARPNTSGQVHVGAVMNRPAAPTVNVHPAGRWPANVLLDHHAAKALDQQSGTLKSGDLKPYRNASEAEFTQVHITERNVERKGDSGGASRFFKVVEPDPPFTYAAKAPKRERPSYTTEDGQTVQHATVKPLSIMQWLVKLVTPPGGVVLDPFAGSGTTIEAALIEGFNPVGIEMETDYLPLIQHRIERTDSRVKAPTPLEVDPDQLDMLSMLDGTA